MDRIFGCSAGISVNDDLKKAAREAAEIALGRFSGGTSKAALIFTSTEDACEIVRQGVAEIFDGDIIGYASNGQFVDDAVGLGNAVSVILIGGKVDVKIAFLGDGSQDSPQRAFDAGRALGDEFKNVSTKGKLVLVFPLSPGVEVVDGLKESMGQNVPILGGCSRTDAGKTYQFTRDKIFEKGIIALMISGDFTPRFSIADFFVPMSPIYTITAANGSTVECIEGVPAFKFYQEYLEAVLGQTIEKPDSLHGQYPVCLVKGNEYIPLDRGVLLENKAILFDWFKGDISEGTKVVISARCSPQTNYVSARKCIASLLAKCNKKPDAILLIDCVGRKGTLAETSKEVKIIHRSVPASIPVAGVYVSGELGPRIEMEQDGVTNCKRHSFAIIGCAIEPNR